MSKIRIRVKRIGIRGKTGSMVVTPAEMIIYLDELEELRKSYTRDESDVVRMNFEEVED